MDDAEVILVNERDEEIGVMGKLEVHQKGLRHRAFSIFIFDEKGRMLLQQRSAKKYHGALLWTNSCCSHPRPSEKIEHAAIRRLEEEMGFTTPLEKIFVFEYHSPVENNLIENEIDHVFIGQYSGEISINKNEVAAYTFKSMAELKEQIIQKPQIFTTWFKIAFEQVEQWWLNHYKAS
ncbi:MAG TPA: isopentenyl-diphosphate Delta-isomerase [Flavisolibacter sp.]|nr:isopentenyl-diphosphate Delta-isomerase [Flavisolibacter sp.]